MVSGEYMRADESRVGREREVAVERFAQRVDRVPLRLDQRAIAVVDETRDVECSRHREPGGAAGRERGRVLRHVAERAAERAEEEHRRLVRLAECHEPVDRVVAQLAQQGVAADEAGHRRVGIGLGRVHQDVGIRPHAELDLGHAVERQQRRERGASGRLVVADPARRDRGTRGRARIHRRHVHEGHRELTRRIAQCVAQCAQDRARIARDTEGGEHDSGERVRPEVEPRDDPEVSAAAPQRPEQVGVRGARHLEHLTARRDDLRPDELIGREAPRPHHPADPAAEGEPADSDRRGVAGAHAESVLGERVGDIAPRRAAAHVHERAVDGRRHGVRRDRASGRRAASPHALCPPPRTMTSRRSDAGVPQRRAHIVDGRRPDDDGRLADAGMEAARGVPFVVAGFTTAPGARVLNETSVMRSR